MFKKIKRYAKNPYYALGYDMIKSCPKLMSDKFYLSVLWKMVMGYELDWKHPKTFTEKIQWLKLYDHNRLYTTLVDKYRVKQWVADRIGEQFVIPTLAVYNSVNEISLNKLPDQFVLKCNHDSGSVVICPDKSLFDFNAAREKIGRCLRHNFYWDAREWAYKNVKRNIIAECFIGDDCGFKDIPDYKWYCFSGEPVFCQVIQDRNGQETIDFFDSLWNHQEFVGLNPESRNSSIIPSRPQTLSIQLDIARKLSRGIVFCRVDLYETCDHVYFGEMTFYPRGGFGEFKPKEFDKILGRYINI